jgi:hypothetical protein
MNEFDYTITPIDWMLQNTRVMETSIIIILISSFIVFTKIKKINFFFIAIFLAVKFTFSSYIDDYIDHKRNLQIFKERNFVGVKVLSSLIISIPFLLLGFYLGKRVPLEE